MTDMRIEAIEEFYICSFDEAKELVEALYQESLKKEEAVA